MVFKFRVHPAGAHLGAHCRYLVCDELFRRHSRCPQVSFHRTALFIVVHRQRALLNLYVFLLHYPFPQLRRCHIPLDVLARTAERADLHHQETFLILWLLLLVSGLLGRNGLELFLAFSVDCRKFLSCHRKLRFLQTLDLQSGSLRQGLYTKVINLY